MSDNFSNPTPQFGTAEYVGTPGGDHCRYCQQPVSGSYYRVNNNLACPSCADVARGELARDNHAAYLRGLIFGIGAGILGLILYATFTIVTGIAIGYVSVAVGWMVGKAIMKGSNGIGGRRYQITAVLLTYAAVSMAMVPVWIYYSGQHKEKGRQSRQQRLEDDQKQLEPGSAHDNEQSSSGPARTPVSLGTSLARVALICLASPFIELWGGGPSLGWLIGLVILFVGMRFAWRITAGRPLAVLGPFQSAPGTVR